jgi:hypothetical protein
MRSGFSILMQKSASVRQLKMRQFLSVKAVSRFIASVGVLKVSQFWRQIWKDLKECFTGSVFLPGSIIAI